MATMVIDPKLLDQLQADALRCEKQHLDALDKIKAIGARMKADTDARQCMCAVLQQIRQFNKGKLVGKKLKNWWSSYGCAK